MIDFFSMDKLTLNIGKSGFLIINPGIMDQKCNIVLPSGILKYKQYFEYLGIIISDSGVLKHDIKSFIDKNRSNVSIKFANFCQVNKNDPLYVKLKTFESCVSTTLTYACETWGNNFKDAELPYRAGLKISLNIRENISNKIVYVESTP